MLKSLLNTKNSKIVAGNYLALLFIQGANMILPLVVLPYLVRVIGAEKYGLIMFAQAFCTILYVFVEFGFNLSATRRISIAQNNEKEKAVIFSSVLFIKILLLISVFVIYVAIVFCFDRFNVEKLVYFLSFGVILGQAIFPDWFFQGIEKMGYIAIINVVAKVTFTLLIFSFISNISHYWLVPLFNSIGYIIAGLISLIVSLKFTKLVKPQRELIKILIKESYSLFISNFAARLFNAANIFILGLIAGDFFTGIYASIEKLIVAVKSLFAPFYQALYPWLSKQEKKQQSKSIRKIFPFVLIISIAITIFVLIFSDIGLKLLFDDEQIISFSYILKIMSFTAVLSALNMLLVSLYFPASGMYKTRMKVLVYTGLFNVVLSVFLVNKFQILGTAIAVVSTETLLLVLSYIYYRKSITQALFNE